MHAYKSMPAWEGGWGGRWREDLKPTPHWTWPHAGVDLTTLRSWPQPKSRVGCPTPWPTQAPQKISLQKKNHSGCCVKNRLVGNQGKIWENVATIQPRDGDGSEDGSAEGVVSECVESGSILKFLVPGSSSSWDLSTSCLWAHPDFPPFPFSSVFFLLRLVCAMFFVFCFLFFAAYQSLSHLGSSSWFNSPLARTQPALVSLP